MDATAALPMTVILNTASLAIAVRRIRQQAGTGSFGPAGRTGPSG
jgi:hypothetical protein